MRTLAFPDGADQFIDLDHAFHRCLIDSAHQRWMPLVWSDISALLGVLVTLSVRYLTIDAQIIGDRHQAIVDALSQPEEHRQQAMQAVEDHYASLARWLVHSHQGTDERRTEGG
jgi:DNA-binding FadR family transcriptional regulator